MVPLVCDGQYFQYLHGPPGAMKVREVGGGLWPAADAEDSARADRGAADSGAADSGAADSGAADSGAAEAGA